MNSLYENRIIKLISPINDEYFTIELSGDENELKELIATIINVSPSDIKGLKDTFGNYYTFSCAIKNPRLNSNFSSFFFIVINNNNSLNDIFKNPKREKQNINIGKNQIIQNINNNNNFNNFNFQNFEGTLKNKTDFMNNSLINNNNNINPQNLNPNEKIAYTLFQSNLIDDKNYNQLKELLQEENEEILTLFKLYNNHKNIKKLYHQLKPVLDGITESIRKKNTNQLERKDSGGNYNISYNVILDSIEKEINSKNDMALLRKLVLCDNEQIIKVMEMYEYDNNRQNLLNSLNNILSKYRGRFSVPNNNTISPEELQLIKKVDKMEKKILKCFSSDGNFKQDCILLFKYDMNRLDTNQKMQLFTQAFKIKNKNPITITQNSKFNIKEHYQNLILTSLFPDFTAKQTNLYNECIDNNDENMLNFFKKLINNKDINFFTQKVITYINKLINEKKEDENEEEEEDEEDSLSSFSSSKESEES